MKKVMCFLQSPTTLSKRSESQAHLIRESHSWSQQCSDHIWNLIFRADAQIPVCGTPE